MPYETNIAPFENYIRVEASGGRKPGREVEDAIRVGRQISDACRSHGVKKILLITKITGRLPPTEAYEIFSKPEEFGWSRDIKAAFVDENPDSREDSLFSETIAVNRAYNMQVFDEEDEALEWLLDN